METSTTLFNCFATLAPLPASATSLTPRRQARATRRALQGFFTEVGASGFRAHGFQALVSSEGPMCGNLHEERLELEDCQDLVVKQVA